MTQDQVTQWLQQNPAGNVRTIQKDGMFATNLRLNGRNVLMGPLCPDPVTALHGLEAALSGAAVVGVGGTGAAIAAATAVEKVEAPSLASKLLGSPKQHISTAAYRLGARKLVKLVREPMIEQMKALASDHEEKKIVAFLTKFMCSGFGDAIISNALAATVAVMPLPAAVAKVIDQQALANELRDQGYTEGLDAATEVVIAPMQLILGAAVQQIVPILTQGAIGELPEQATTDE
jgi:hypothetical protein